jgi:hypothetical protein
MAHEKDGPNNQLDASRSGGKKPGSASKKTGGGGFAKSAAPPPPLAPESGSGEGGVEMSDEPPIIIQGGGSVFLNIPTKFKEKGTNKGGGKYKNDTQNLISIQIDNREPIPLDADSTIVISCGVRSRSGAQSRRK